MHCVLTHNKNRSKYFKIASTISSPFYGKAESTNSKQTADIGQRVESENMSTSAAVNRSARWRPPASPVFYGNDARDPQYIPRIRAVLACRPANVRRPFVSPMFSNYGDVTNNQPPTTTTGRHPASRIVTSSFRFRFGPNSTRRFVGYRRRSAGRRAQRYLCRVNSCPDAIQPGVSGDGLRAVFGFTCTRLPPTAVAWTILSLFIAPRWALHVVVSERTLCLAD